MKQATAAEVTPVGIQTFRWYENIPVDLEQAIDQLSKTPLTQRAPDHRARYLELFGQIQKYKVREERIENIVVTVGRSVIAQRLAGTTTYTGIVNYGALGSSSTTPTNSDTQLGTEVFRKVVASASFTTNVAFIDFFYSQADTSGTYNEFGTFIDGTGTANSGQLFSHVLTGGWVKSGTQSMTVSAQYTLS